MQTPRTLVAGLVVAALSGATGRAQQSNTFEFQPLPAAAPITVDGRLEDWDLSGQVECYADLALRDRHGVRVAGQWTPEALYLSAHWKDPTPMTSRIDPDFEPDRGWVSDSWQIRMVTDQVLHITTWCFTPRQEAAMHIDYTDYATQKKTAEPLLLRAPGGGALGHGAEMAYRPDADGQGCVQEIRLPWALLYRQPPAAAAGLAWRMGWEFLWGDASAKQWPLHRYADLVDPTHIQREFFWSNQNAWGKAVLAPRGNLAATAGPTPGAGARPATAGRVVIDLGLPAAAARFTVAVNDGAGRRVRNLVGDAVPADYAADTASLATGAGGRTVRVRWDGTDDAGQWVTAGDYTAVGLWHEGLHARYQMSYDNPGTPPWDTPEGTGNWGADHTDPRAVATAADRVFLGWPLAEGGWSIIALGPDGRKLWSFKRGWGGATCLAATDEYLFVGLEEGQVYRLHTRDGSFAPFAAAAGPATDLFVGKPGAAGNLLDAFTKPLGDLAVHGGALVLCLPAMDRLLRVDASTGAKLGETPLPSPRSAAFDPQGRLYVVSGRDVVRVAVDSGAVEVVVPATPDWDPVALATDAEANLVVADTGPDMQVKVFSPTGKRLRRIGAKGGRPAVGEFDPDGLRFMTAVDVDSRGNTWVVESDDRPRRISAWSPKGKRVRDYIGNTNYGATGSFLDPRDPTRGFFNGMEFKLDYGRQQYRLVRTLWRRQVDNAYFDCTGNGGALVWSAASGRRRPYLAFSVDDREYMTNGVAIFVPAGDHWRPAAAVGGVQRRNQYVPGSRAPGTPFETHQGRSFAWSDANGDGLTQDDELRFTERFGQLGCGWSVQVGDDLTVCLSGREGTVRVRPTAWARDRAPVYDLDRAERVLPEDDGNVLPLADGSLLMLSFRGYADATRGILRYPPAGGDPLWCYPNPFPGVHGSHRAPMPKPGLVIGPLRITGVASVAAPVGPVVALQGNLGQEYFLTVDDGLYVGALFRDVRLAPDPPPATAQAGADLDACTLGSEPFGGWLGQGPDGTVRLLTGGQDVRVTAVTGLNTVRRLPPQPVHLTEADIRQAREAAAGRPQPGPGRPQLTIWRARTPPTVDGDLGDWATVPVPETEVRAGDEVVARVRLQWDDTSLYAAYAVTDPSPLRNRGQDWKVLFKSGDAVDLLLGTAADAPADRAEAGPGDLRLLFTVMEDQPLAVLYQPVVPGTPADRRVTFTSPVQTVDMDRVVVLATARVAVRREAGRYRVEAAVPLAELGLKPHPGLRLGGDFGVIFSDADGTANLRRCYWASPPTNLVSDTPSEARLVPRDWGVLVVQ